MFLGAPLPPGFAARIITLPPGESLAYRAAEWRDTLVIVEHGMIDLEPVHGTRHRFPGGAMLCLNGIRVRAVRNPGSVPAVLLAITRKDPLMERSPVLQRLEVLIGEWEMSVETGGVTFGGARTTFEWLEDGAFVVQRAHSGPPSPDIPAAWRDNSPLPTISIIGLDDSAESFTALYSDARGVSRVYTMTFDGTLWTQHRAAPGFHQRFFGNLSADGKTITARWEGSPDGATWSLDFNLTFTRVG